MNAEDVSTPDLRLGLQKIRSRVAPTPVQVEGRLVRAVGLTMEARGCEAPIGSHCDIVTPEGVRMAAEVVGFSDERLQLMPLDEQFGVAPGARVLPQTENRQVRVGDALLGRVVDGAGRPLDGRGYINCVARVPLTPQALNPLERSPVVKPLDVGVRAINGLLTIGEGQRIGLFAGSGVGKSTLLSALTRNTEAEIVVIALIGERGREVRDFVDDVTSSGALSRTVVVATPADSTPVMRIQGALRATAIAEHFRAEGRSVLLLMDSLTRYAQAQREVSLSAGEFPVAKGYTPSVFTMLPRLVERAGNAAGGSITGIYTVLVEGDDPDDPVADAARAILDGHIMLSRAIAETGLYPAIDVSRSVSRLLTALAEPAHLEDTRNFRRLFAAYEQNRDLIAVGAYTPGSDPTLDEAVRAYPLLRAYVEQPGLDAVSMEESVATLQGLFGSPGEMSD